VPDHLTFDSEAILSFFLGEAGGELVRDSLEKVQKKEIEGYINILNLTEIYYILSRVSPKIAEEKQRNLRLYGLKVVAINDNGLWREAAKLKCNHAMSLADAFAVATAQKLKTKLMVGSDEEFNNLNVELLRIRG
jgi:predicted nucleic acid-binding protein